MLNNTVNRKKISINFWCSEFVILIISNHFRWISKLNINSFLCSLLIIIIVIQFLIFFVKFMCSNKINIGYILLLSFSYIFSNLSIVLANFFWFKSSNEVNFPFLIILSILLSPLIIVLKKMKTE